MKLKRTNFYISDTHKKKLNKLAKQQKVSVGVIIRNLIENICKK